METLNNLPVGAISQHPGPSIVIPSPASRVFMVSTHVKCGSLSVSFADEGTAASQNGGKTRHTLPIFEAASTEDLEEPRPKRRGKSSDVVSIKKSNTLINNLLGDLKDKYMKCSGGEHWWFFSEEFHDAVLAGLEEIREQRDREIRILESHYEEAQELYELRVTDTLTRHGKLELLGEFLSKFPTREELAEAMTIEIEGPMPLPSAEELAGMNPAFRLFFEQVRKQFVEEVPRLGSDLMELIADILNRLEITDPSSLTEKQVEVLRDRLEKLLAKESLLINATGGSHMSNPVLAIAHRTKRLIQKFQQQSDREELLEQLTQFKLSVVEEPWITRPTTRGEHALARWAGHVSLEDRLQALHEATTDFDQRVKTGDLKGKEREYLEIKLRAERRILKAILDRELEHLDFFPSGPFNANPDVLEAGF